MKLDFIPAADHGLTATAELLSRAFADYHVRIPFTEPLLWQTARADSVDFAASQVVRLDGEPVGVALMARRGWTSRVAGMALVPEARRRGAGRVLMEHLIAEGKARGDRHMVLEVIEQNVAAVRLYENSGFRKIRRLVGFAGRPPAGLIPVPELAEADLRVVSQALAGQDTADWPWQLSAETVAQLTPPFTGWVLDGAWLALAKASGAQVGIRALGVEGSESREKRAVRLLHAVMARFPDHEWRMSSLWPEELGSWFAQAGLVRQELTQWQMIRGL